MSVDPLKSNALPHPDAGRCGPTSAARRPDGHPTVEISSEQPAADRVHRSAAWRSLVDRRDEVDCIPEGTVSPKRMREVLRRLEQDYYNGAEVQDKVARGIRQDLGLSRVE
jgi:hypothetical protein